MNKVILLLIFLLFNLSSYGTIRILKHNTGPKGCNISNEKHDNGLSVLSCKDAGFQKCEFTYLPKGKKDIKLVKKTIKMVEKAINDNKLIGEFNVNNRAIVYEGTDLYNYSITIQD